MYRLLKGRSDGFRKIPGTVLKNESIGNTVFVPPQDARMIVDHMTALERFINDDNQSDLDPLIKMALVHHQFESTHPFSDGNGRIGRILSHGQGMGQGLSPWFPQVGGFGFPE